MELHALGSNGSGQLGVGHFDDISEPVVCKVPPAIELSSAESSRVVAGGNHTILLTSAGQILSSGKFGSAKSRIGSVSVSSEDTSSFHLASGIPTDADASAKNTWVHCSATWEASFAVPAKRDSIYACGQGSKGELGFGKDVLHAPAWTLMYKASEPEHHIVEIASGMNHTVAVLSNGEVIGWGNGKKGQLGEPKAEFVTPRKIQGIPFKAVGAVCGRDFTFIVSSSDEGRHVIFGPDKWNIISDAPENVKGYRAIGASWCSVYVLSQSGLLAGWGRNDHGQLPPSGLPLVQQFAAGSEHCLAITVDGRVLAWGWGEHGNCGNPVGEFGDVVGRWNELSLDGKPLKLHCGCATSWILIQKQSEIL
jgi:protein ATS1